MKRFLAAIVLALLVVPLARGAELQFSGIALDLRQPYLWAAKHDMTSQQYAEDFQKRRSDRFRLYHVAAYPKAGTVKFAALWVKDGSQAASWSAFHDQTPDQYQKTFNDMKAQGRRPQHVTGYMVGGSHRLASIFTNDGVTDWIAAHDQTEEQHQQMLSQWQAKGYRPICASAYPTKSGTRFALVMEKNPKNYQWQVRRNMTPAEYQDEFKKWTSQGYRPTQACGCTELLPGHARYSAIFLKGGAEARFSARHDMSEKDYQAWIGSLEKDKLIPVYVSAFVGGGPVELEIPRPTRRLPMSGTDVPELAAYDVAMQAYMSKRGIKAGTLAVMHNGNLVLSRGYGWLDAGQTRQCAADTPMRIASLVKPFTRAAVAKLVRDGKLRRETKVFALLGTKPPPGQTMDKRLLDINVQQLLDHRGGWDKRLTDDPMVWRSIEIAKALGKASPANANDIIRFMAGQPLDFDPGTKEAYSNFGYCVLGRVIEKASGMSYVDYVKSEVATRALPSIRLGRTLPKDRSLAEPIYLAHEETEEPTNVLMATNVMEPGSTVKVPWPDGGFCLEAMDSHGGLVASARDLVKFSQAYFLSDGSVRSPGSKPDFAVVGMLPGTYAFVAQRPDGVNIAVLFNQRGKAPGFYNDIKEVLNKVTDGVKSWPKSLPAHFP